MFKKAERKQARLRLALTGPSGSGKTYSALLIAKGLGGKIAVVDTEHGSASLYSDLADFDVLELTPPYKPENFIKAIKEAEESGYSTIILDSITHEWNGSGGVLEIVDNASRTRYSKNSYMAWSEGTPRHQAFVDAILQTSLNVICTMRSKTAYDISANEKGKLAPVKVGLAPQQRDGLEYEFTTVLDLSLDKHLAIASKDRTRLFSDAFTITAETGQKLLEWLNEGIETPKQETRRGAETSETAMPDLLRPRLIKYLQSKYGNDSARWKQDLGDFFKREIKTSKELTDTEIESYLEAVN